MPVAVTESRLPSGLAATDLGQASTPVSGPNGGTYQLVSYLTTPAVTGTRLDYVVFSTGRADADFYRWQIDTVPKGSTPLQVHTSTLGIFHWTATVPSDVRVSVAIDVDGSVVATLRLDQTVTPPDAGSRRTSWPRFRRARYLPSWDRARRCRGSRRSTATTAPPRSPPSGNGTPGVQPCSASPPGGQDSAWDSAHGVPLLGRRGPVPSRRAGQRSVGGRARRREPHRPPARPPPGRAGPPAAG